MVGEEIGDIMEDALEPGVDGGRQDTAGDGGGCRHYLLDGVRTLLFWREVGTCILFDRGVHVHPNVQGQGDVLFLPVWARKAGQKLAG